MGKKIYGKVFSMEIINYLYSNLIMVLSVILMLGFLSCYFKKSQKKDFLLLLLFGVYFFDELFRNLFPLMVHPDSIYQFTTVTIEFCLSFIFFGIILEQLKNKLSKWEQIILGGITILVLAIAYSSILGNYFHWGFYISTWGAIRLYRERTVSKRSFAMFWIMTMLAVLQYANLALYIYRYLVSDTRQDSITITVFSELMLFIIFGSAIIQLIFNLRSYLRENTYNTDDNAEKATDLQKIIIGLAKEYELTKREQEMLEFLMEGYTYTQISEKLFISKGTVKTHVHNLYQKLGVTNRNQIAPDFFYERVKN